MKTYKTFTVIAVSLLVAFGMLCSPQAALCCIANGWNRATSMDPVSFYLYDLDNSHDAILSADTLSFFPPAIGSPQAALEYNINNGDWESFSGPLSIEYGDADYVQIALRLQPIDDRNDNQFLTGGDIIFQNYDEANSKAGLDLFQALFVVWDMNHHPTVTFSSANDPVTPHAPIPASALLLFTGLIGIIGFRRRLN